MAGDWLDPDVRATELEPVPTQSPISDHAKDLLTEFLRRESFWRRVKEDGLPVGFAGAAYLFVKQRQAYKVLDELEEAEGPWQWFRARAAEALASGKIGGGKATRGCPIADCFFTELAGGTALLDNLKVIAFGGRRKVPVKEARLRVSSIGGEIIDYLVYGHINTP